MNYSSQQEHALRIVSRWMREPSAPQVMYLAGYAGTGKCLGIGTPVLMHDGTMKPVEHVQVDDLVMGPDSMPRRVLSLARGQSPLYRVVPVKGDPWVCNEDHIMTLVDSKIIGKTIDISVRDLLNRWPGQPDAIWKLWRTGVDFPTAQQAIDPYWLGLWLGDVQGRKVSNPLRNETRRCLDAQGRKMIPCEYLVADRTQRLAVLAGIVDTDGHITNGCVDIVTVSEPLRDGILFLARSLGFAAYSKECTKRIRSTGFVGQYHRIFISGDLSELPCRVPHKKPPPRRQIKRTNVTGFRLEPLGPGDYYGFELDGDGRFLLGDFTVTHNSTLAKTLVASSNRKWLFAAYTGKAAHVLHTKGCTGARTIHSLIYRFAGEVSRDEIAELERELSAPNTPDARRQAITRELLALRRARGPRFVLWETGPLSADDIGGIVVDEVSMVSEDLGRDLESFGRKILVLGDPAQLPPVRGGGYFTNREPDVMLTEVHRHARDSGVLRLATHIREGGSASSFQSAPDAEILSSLTPLDQRTASALSADQVLVGLNKTRHDLNQRYRTLRERTERLPYAGDRLVCLRNERDTGLFNGSQWIVVDATWSDATGELTVRSEDDGRVVATEAWTHHFVGRGEELELMGPKRRDNSEFDWGYALTCHKAQGSQYPRVFVVDESKRLGGDPRRWIYTAVTRSSDHVTVLI